MATFGVRQLTRLSVSYCEHGGSSRGVRAIISSGGLVDFALANSDAKVVVYTQNGQHPFVRGEYVTGWDKTIGVKNLDENIIMKKIGLLSNSSGRKLLRFKKVRGLQAGKAGCRTVKARLCQRQPATAFSGVVAAAHDALLP